MVIITGPGRSGTSLIAKVYRELGFDPGGEWIEEINAGLESHEIVRANAKIMSDLGVGLLGPPRTPLMPAPVARAWKRVAPVWVDTRLRLLFSRLPALVMRRRGFMRWDRFEDVVEKHRTALQALADSYDVMKDPRFCWTLDVWAAAGVEIDRVLLCVRALDASIRSRYAAGHLELVSGGEARTWTVYGLGLCMTAIANHRLAFRVLRFPDFLTDPEKLYGELSFPRPVSRQSFMQVFERVVRPELVHDQR